MKIGPLHLTPVDLLLVFVPVVMVLEFTHADPVWIFVISCLSIVPLAGLMGRATEHLSERVGPGLGGLLNATFGNAAELIIALLALNKGLIDVVKASITGSIIGNILLVLGLAVLLGGLRFEKQEFNRVAAGQGATALALAAVALLVPAVFHSLVPAEHHVVERNLSLDIAIVLFVVYLLSLWFSLKTHSHLYGGPIDDDEVHDHEIWSTKKAVMVLVGATIGVGVIAEFLVGAVEHTAEVWGMTDVFVGVILVAIVGNAAEHSTAVLVALKSKNTDLVMNIAIGSAIQIALFVAPVLVFAGLLMGQPMDLVFTPFEVMAVTVAVALVALIALDGESHWMEGVQLLAVYLILGIAFFFLPG